jgi:hypothetical protein
VVSRDDGEPIADGKPLSDAGPEPGDARARRAAYDGERVSWIRRRRDKVAAEIERNRRGEYKVPTWALALLLLVLVAGWVAVIAYS